MDAHLRPTAPIAADVLLPADPGLAMAIAQRVLERPLMANHSHGLWGYSGRADDGRALTVQASGLGGPSAAAVVTELARHGARRAIRVGRALALDAALGPGDRLVVGSTLGGDGTSAALGIAAPEPDPPLTAALAHRLESRPATIAATDLLHDPAAGPRRDRWRRAGAVAVDLESAAAFAAGARWGIAVAAALVVGPGPGDGEADLEAELVEVAAACAQALGDADQEGAGGD